MDSLDLMERLDRLATCTESRSGLTRLYLSPEHHQAIAMVQGWMRQAGLATRLDAAATLIGRLEGPPGAPTFLIGSHIDTVRDAGRYDGNFGVLAGLAALERLRAQGLRLPFAVELLAFGDEEGVRFPVTMTGSRAFAGTLDVQQQLAARDASGISMEQALQAFGCDPARLAEAARSAGGVLGYLELHIEQGPVLEQAGLALGVVTAINGACRFTVSVTGMAGHAGTVPMQGRRDALAAACEMVVAVRNVARDRPSVTATVGRIEGKPGAVNVIAGHAEFSLDIRAPDDGLRDDAASVILAGFASIADAHGVGHSVTPGFEASAAPCTPALQARLESAATALGIATMRLPSGAGHDAMVMAALCPIAMLFVRCKGGISHNPAESITRGDAALAVDVLTRMLADYAQG